MFSCKFCEISKNTISNRAPPVAASNVGIFYENSDVSENDCSLLANFSVIFINLR